VFVSNIRIFRGAGALLMKLRTAFLALCLISATALTGCQNGELSQNERANQRLPKNVLAEMSAKDMDQYSPIMIRIFKEESTLEVWKQKRNGQYDLIASYDICKWSGKLGPKFMEGDRQAPEGFYTVSPAQMNPRSHYYLSFDIGFPNAYDRVNGRTGRHLMVHGACSSSGCYSMSDKNMAQIYAFGRDSFIGGQREFQIEAFPFRMTATNMARYRKDSNYKFWTMLKQGYDQFEITKRPPKVDVCDKHYVFNIKTTTPLSPAGACPANIQDPILQTAFNAYETKYDGSSKATSSETLKRPAPSILGVEEARIVADWSRKRSAGQVVSREPPSLTAASAETPNAPDIMPPAAIPSKPNVAAQTAGSR